MLTKITLPSGGTNTDQLRVVSWKKAEGDAVKRGDVLLEVETDKAVLEVESFAKGTLLKRLLPEGSFGTVGDVIAYVGEPGDLKTGEAEPAAKALAGDGREERPPAAPRAAPSRDETKPVVPVDPSGREAKVTPAAKKKARDHGLDLAEVYRAAGKDVLRRDDVVRFVDATRRPPEAPTATGTGPGRDVGGSTRAEGATSAGDVAEFTLVPLTPMRRSIARRMELGSSVPTFTAEVEVDMTRCVRLRSELNQLFDGVRFGYHDIIAKCAALAAADFPLVNASFTDEGIRLYRSVNIGIAVSLEQGLVVPVVRDVRGKSLAALAEANAANVAQVRTGKFDPKLLENGTITISNLGKHPIRRFTAVLNPPQSCILAVGAIQSLGIWVDGQLREQPTAAITGTFDHRVVDGNYGAEFLTRLKKLLESPHLALVH